ncbi:MAG: adenylate/guanylate cyclase domain-containing protein [bacterium]|jgi:class 3 adenylate cyclase|nr:adenylate/guanylate cyclase domain-containing protein [bacterium]
MKNSKPIPSQTNNSKTLEDQLKQVLQKRNQIEIQYRETQQKFWTILFIDISQSIQDVWTEGEDKAHHILDSYQQTIRSLLVARHVAFLEPGGGTQIVCCFDAPDASLLAAEAVMRMSLKWNMEQARPCHILPAIGINQGYIVYQDGIIHQSNTNNLAKRIQTLASPGQILVSSALYESLASHPDFEFVFFKRAFLKNIPVAQDIYQAKILADVPLADVIPPPRPAIKPISARVEPVALTSAPQNAQALTFIHIDVCESTKKFWSYGDREASALIQEYQTLCHGTFALYGCLISQACEGDQIIAAFEPNKTDHAIMATVKILQCLFRRNTRVPIPKQVRAAIGIHYGEMLVKGNEIVPGKDVRTGKEIQSLAAADEILVSQTVSDLLTLSLKPYLDSYGTYQFFGLADPLAIYTLNWIRVPVRINAGSSTTVPKYPRR